MVRIETQRLTIRDYLKTDLHEMHRLWSDPQAMYYLPDLLCGTLDETRRFLQTGLDNADGHYFAVCENPADTFIGSVGYTLTARTPVGNIAHMGYMLLPEYSGRGYVTEAVTAALRFAFTQDNIIRITTGCLTEHEASRRVMEKTGFRKEGHRIAAQWHDGKMKDRWEYAVNKDDFIKEANI
jgi:ribosomal-protein-alanine N-acetyltransferase